MDMQSLNSLGMSLTTLIITAGIGIGIFLLCRQLILWYFRINQMADDLHIIAAHYEALQQKEFSERMNLLRSQKAATPANRTLPTHPSLQSAPTRRPQSLSA